MSDFLCNNEPESPYNRMVMDVLINPAAKYDELHILVGAASSAMVQRHVSELEDHLIGRRIKIELICGRSSSEGIAQADHEGFKQLMRLYDNFTCSYMMIGHRPCNVKLYIWYKGKNPELAFIGSADYSQKAFFSNDCLEAMYECDPIAADKYYNSFSASTAYCNNDEIEDMAIITAKGEQYIDANETYVSDSICLSLLSSNGEMGRTSSLNWGQRDGRNKNQAYIPISRPDGIKIVETNFFPPKKTVFTVITDDGFTFYCVTAGNKADDPIPKCIESSHDNSELGIYFRRRLGLQSGAFVTKEDLERYGRTAVKFVNLGDGTYQMDFSSNKR